MADQNKVQWIYSSHNAQELEGRYDQWAKDYDADLQRDFEYTAPKHAAETFAQHVSKDARVLDAGAGTGLAGEALFKLGYSDLVAMDLSKGMLAEARKKNVYKTFFQMVMGETLDFPTASFGAIICTGTLTVAHAPVISLDELVRITKPGGHIVFTLRPDLYEKGGFREKQGALETEGKWKLVEAGEMFQPLPKGEPEVFHQVWVYQVN
jgi:SAM-dependent methyltransferase